jgi:hypothetical protein
LVAAGYSEDQTPESVPRPTIFKYFNNKKQVMWEYNAPIGFRCSGTTSANAGNFQDVIEANGNYYAIGFVTTSSNCASRDEEILIARIPVQVGAYQQAQVTTTELHATSSGANLATRAYSIRPIIENGQAIGFIVCGTVSFSFFGDNTSAFIMKLKLDLSKDETFGIDGCRIFDPPGFMMNRPTQGRQAVVHYNGSTPDGFFMIGDILPFPDPGMGMPDNPNKNTDVYFNGTDMDGKILPGVRHTYNDLEFAAASLTGYTASQKTTAICGGTDLSSNKAEHGIGIEQVGEVDENYINIDAHRLGVNEHISMLGVKGVKFFDCRWNADYDGTQGVYGIGIRSWDASAYVSSTGSAVSKSTPNFKNLAWGIDAGFSNGSAIKSYSITNNLFQNVMSNIRITNGASTNIDRNVFRDIPQVENTARAGYGINLSESLLNTVSRNKFFGPQGAAASANRGIMATNTSLGSAAAQSNIIGNDFTDIRWATQIQKENSQMTIRCNNFTRTPTAMAINLQSPDGPFNDQGVCFNQLNQAGNKFIDRVCNLPGKHILSGLNAAHTFTYNFRAGQPLEVPDCVAGNVITNECSPLVTNIKTCDDVQGIIEHGCNWVCDDFGCGWECNIPPDDEFAAINAMTNTSNRLLLKSKFMRYNQSKADSNRLMAVLSSENSLVYKKLSARVKMEMKKSNEARALHSQLLAQNSISTDYYSLYSILTDLTEQNKNVTQLNSAQIATIRAISNGNSDVKYTAKGILSFVLGEEYTDYIERETNSFGNSNSGNAFIKAVNPSTTTTMVLTPNPTQDVLNVQFSNTNELTKNARIILTDMFGHTVKDVLIGEVGLHSLDIQNLPNGIYFCNLQSDQKIIEIQKFTIIK